MNIALDKCLIISGLLLGLLLPIGMSESFGVNSTVYSAVFVLHLAILCVAVYLSAKTIFEAIINSGWPKLPLFLLIGLTFVFLIALGSLPITAGDALIHHIVVPKWWLEAGTIHYLDSHLWSNYPMLLNLAYVGIMGLAPAEFCAVYHGTYLFILIALIIQFLNKEEVDPKVSLLAGLLILGLPMFLRLASIPLVDLGLATYSFLCLIFIVQAKNYFFAGIALGLALSIKYNAILAAIVFAGLLAISLISDRAGLKNTLKYLGIFLLAALIIYSPWMIKNYAWTSNPLYPLFNSIFGVKGPSSLGVLNPIEHRRLIYNETWIDFITLPFRMLFFGQDYKGKFFDGVLHPGLILGFVGIFACWGKKWVKSFTFFSVLYFLLATTLAVPRARYLSPIFAAWICLSSVGAVYLVNLVSEKYKNIAFFLLIAAYFSYAGFYLNKFSKRKLLFPYIKNEISKDNYLKLSVPDYELITWINKELPETSKVYLLNTPNRFLYFERKVTTSGQDSAAGIVEQLRESESASAIAKALSEQGITHIMANIPRTISIMESELKDEERLKWNNFQTKHLKPLVESGSTALWELKING